MKKVFAVGGIFFLLTVGTLVFAASPGEKIILKLGSVATEKDIQYEATKIFSNYVKEKTKGQVDIQLFFSGQLGNETDMIDSLQMGAIQMMQSFPSKWAPYIAEMGVLDIPFQFKDFDHVCRVTDSKVGSDLSSLVLKKTKVRVVKYWLHGFRHLFTQKPIQSAADMKGVKIRVPGIPVYVETFKLLGAVPVSVAWTEVYTALQTGLVNACEAPFNGGLASKFNEVTKYVIKTGHIYTASFLVINEASYQKLDPAYKQIIADGANEAEKWLYNRLITQDQEDEKTLASKGMTIMNPDLKSFQDRLTPLVDSFLSKVDAKNMIAEIDRLR